MKKSKKVILIIFLMLLLLFNVGKIVIGNMIKNVQHISVSMSGLSDVQDGNYVGEYSILPLCTS